VNMMTTSIAESITRLTIHNNTDTSSTDIDTTTITDPTIIDPINTIINHTHNNNSIIAPPLELSQSFRAQHPQSYQALHKIPSERDDHNITSADTTVNTSQGRAKTAVVTSTTIPHTTFTDTSIPTATTTIITLPTITSTKTSKKNKK